MMKGESPSGFTPLLPRKRTLSSEGGRQTPTTFDNSLYDELILLIFSYLSYSDLCNTQRTNSNWARLSLDNQLWRNLYLREFGKSRLRGSRGSPAHATLRADGKEIKPLPGRAWVQADLVKDWKWMFRVSSNWRTGRSSETEEVTWPDADDPDLPVHVALAGGLIITASPLPSRSPPIRLHTPGHGIHLLATSSLPSNSSNKITTLALDQSQPNGSEYRLAAFYDTGNFSLFLTSPLNPMESAELLFYVPITRRHRLSPIMQAVYHHPLLITLSTAFDLTIYELFSDESDGLPPQIRLAHTLTSFTSYPPASLILSNPSPNNYKLLLSYSVPVYPSHWTIAVTELIISSFMVQSTQSTSAFDLQPGWSPLTPDLSDSFNEQYARKLSGVSSTSTDGKYVALAGASTNTIQLYRLSSRSRLAGPRLTFLRTLHGHLSPVQALSVADGRCVSLSRDGSLWVWDLERGGVEVKTEGLHDLPASVRVLFDERRIIVVLNGRIIIKRFDV